MGIAQEIKELNGTYSSVSVDCMRVLCKEAGIPFYEPKDSNRLVREAYENGFIIRNPKFNVPDVVVGQYLLLRNLNGELIKGYKIYIDLKTFEIKSDSILSDDDIIDYSSPKVFH